MAKVFSNDRSQASAGDDDRQPSEALETLRRIVVGPESERIHRLEQRLDDVAMRADELSHVLPEAIELSTAGDRKLAKSLQPTIEDAIRASVSKNPKVLADAIFPLMGPGIRRAIAATIMGMIQSFNQLLNHSFSIQGFKWRIESLRTHKPYAEIVLLHTLLYQVEQVFLIHRRSGLVLQHVVGTSVSYQDPDLVSGMLTAIEDFVRDSFGVTSDQSLDTLRIGSERSIWIEQGTLAIVAAVIRGTPPLELRHRMVEILNSIHFRYRQLLDEYQGDAAAFENTREELSSCLDTEFTASQNKISPLIWIGTAILLIVMVLWGFDSLRYYRRTEQFIAALRRQPGIVLTDVDKRGKRLLISGLKDPLAKDPAPLSSSFDLSSDQVDYQWQAYVSLVPEFIVIRAKHTLQPPSTVSLSMDEDVLVVRGEAHHRWIRRLREMGPVMPGINRVRADKLVDRDMATLREIRRRIEHLRILFPIRGSTISADQTSLLAAFIDDVHTLEELSKTLDHPFGIRILGYTDYSGQGMANLKLSRDRAEAVHRFLITNGNINISMMVVGMGTQPPQVENLPGKEMQDWSRCVLFKLLNVDAFEKSRISDGFVRSPRSRLASPEE